MLYNFADVIILFYSLLKFKGHQPFLLLMKTGRLHFAEKFIALLAFFSRPHDFSAQARHTLLSCLACHSAHDVIPTSILQVLLSKLSLQTIKAFTKGDFENNFLQALVGRKKLHAAQMS